MQKYVVRFGLDQSTADHMPVITSCTTIVDADSEKQALAIVEDLYGDDFCGGYADLATKTDIDDWEDAMSAYN